MIHNAKICKTCAEIFEMPHVMGPVEAQQHRDRNPRHVIVEERDYKPKVKK